MVLSNKRIIKNRYGTYERALETDNHIYFLNFDESDENRQVLMFDRKMNLICDNYFGFGALFEDIESKSYTWIINKLKEYLENPK